VQQAGHVHKLLLIANLQVPFNEGGPVQVLVHVEAKKQQYSSSYRHVDVVMVVDVSTSMSKYISWVKMSIQSVIGMLDLDHVTGFTLTLLHRQPAGARQHRYCGIQ
jgi:hypothetical protein